MNDDTEQPRHFRRSDSIATLAGALAKAQGAMDGAKKDAANPFFKSKYADLASVWDAIREPLSANGLAVIQFPRSTAEGVEVETLLCHDSGEWVAETLTLPVGKYDPQGVGSAITYARRYGLQSITGVAPEDDDGNAATKAAQHSAEANGANPRARAVAANARAANPPPPPIKYCTQEQKAAIDKLGHEAGVQPVYWSDVLKHYDVKRLGNLTEVQASEVILDLSKRRVGQLMTELEVTLEYVQDGDKSVTADVVEELDQAQATAALIVLREAKERQPV